MQHFIRRRTLTRNGFGPVGSALVVGGTILLAGMAKICVADDEAKPAVTPQEIAVRFNEVNQNARNIRGAEPAKAIALYQDFLRQYPTSPQAPHAYAEQIQLYRTSLHDPQHALELADEALANTAKTGGGFDLTYVKVGLLVDLQRAPEAEALAEPHLAEFGQVEPGRAGLLLRAYLSSLDAQKKSDQSLATLQNVWQRDPRLLGEGPYSWITQMIIERLQESGDDKAALSWARLRWVECPFDTASITRAATTLAEVWAAVDPKAGQVFAQAQVDANIPNPLAQVALPKVDAELVRKLTEDPHCKPHERVSLWLLLSDTTEGRLKAMRAAMAVQHANPIAPEGVAEICRVFKAVDGNMARANAYLAAVKNGQGDNPIAAFLLENAPADKPAVPVAVPAPQ